VGAVAVVAIVALVLATRSSGSGQPTGSATTPSTTSSTPASNAAQQAAAQQLAGLLSQSGNFRAGVNAAVSDVSGCKKLRTARTAFGDSAHNRQNLLAQLASMSNRSALPAPMLQSLTGAWQASVQVDMDLHDWAQDEISGGCDKQKVQSDPKYQASLGPDSTASSDKVAFTQAWKPIADKYGLTPYQPGQL
jgi:hypothetical protein